MRIDEVNRWWVEKKVPEQLSPLTYRELFGIVKNDLKRRQVQVITGLRRTGKSTILYQLANHLINAGVDPLKVFYCSFDEPELQEQRIESILKDYSRLTGVGYKKEDIYLLLDEVQKAPNWAASVKLVYDNFRNIKIVASGSASLNILSEARKSLAGRVIYYELRPLSFAEFLVLKGITFDKSRPQLYMDTLEQEFEKFRIRPFPELIREDDPAFIRNYIRNAVIDPIILKDIPKEFREADILLLEKLMTVLLSQPGQYIKVEELAKELKRAKRTIYKALFYLEFSYILRSLLNFRPSIRAASRKLSRIYPYHPCLALPFSITEESYAESMVIFQLDAKYYWRDKEKEVDALKDGTPVEVKLKSKISKDDCRWLVYFLSRYGKKLGVRKGYVITKDAEGSIDGVILIPLWQFCLNGLEQH